MGGVGSRGSDEAEIGGPGKPAAIGGQGEGDDIMDGADHRQIAGQRSSPIRHPGQISLRPRGGQGKTDLLEPDLGQFAARARLNHHQFEVGGEVPERRGEACQILAAPGGGGVEEPGIDGDAHG